MRKIRPLSNGARIGPCRARDWFVVSMANFHRLFPRTEQFRVCSSICLLLRDDMLTPSQVHLCAHLAALLAPVWRRGGWHFMCSSTFTKTEAWHSRALIHSFRYFSTPLGDDTHCVHLSTGIEPVAMQEPHVCRSVREKLPNQSTIYPTARSAEALL